MKSTVSALLKPFAEDVADRIALSWGVWDQTAEAWIFHTEDPEPSQIEPGFPNEGWLLQIERNWTLIEPPLTDESISYIAGLVQDAVMDETGKGWPEYIHDGAFVGLLMPMANGDHIFWTLKGSRFCDAGELPAALKA